MVAELRTLHRVFGRTHAFTRSVTIMDISSSGASLVMAYDDQIQPAQVFDLGVDGRWGGVRVVRAERGVSGALLCGVEFLEPCPDFLPLLYR